MLVPRTLIITRNVQPIETKPLPSFPYTPCLSVTGHDGRMVSSLSLRIATAGAEGGLPRGPMRCRIRENLSLGTI